MTRMGTELFNKESDLDILIEGLNNLKLDFEAHNHDGASSKNFETMLAETIRARVFSILKTSYSDTSAGFWFGLVSDVAKLNIGSSTNYLKWTGTGLSLSGEITAVSGSIGGWTIGATTISSAASGERIVLDAGNANLDMINASEHTVAQFNYGSAETSPLLDLHTQDNRRIGLKITTDNVTGTGLNHSLLIDCDSNDSNVFGESIDRDGSSASTIYGMTINSNNAGAGSAIGLSVNAATGIDIQAASVKGIDLYTTANGITISQTGSSSLHSIKIDNDSSSANSAGIHIDRDINSADAVFGLLINCDNVNGAAVGIDINAGAGAGSVATALRTSGTPEVAFDVQSCVSVLKISTDDTDPSNILTVAPTGRIPIKDSEGNTHYLAYW